MFAFRRLCVCFRCPQIPAAITVTKTAWTHLFTVEVAGWLQQQMKFKESEWSMVVSSDVRLAVSLLLRGPVQTNVTLGMLNIENDMEMLKELIEPIKGSVRQQHSLRLVKWNDGFSTSK